LSLAETEIATVSDVELVAMVRETAGADESGSVIVIVLLWLPTFPTASFAQAYKVLFPAPAKVKLAGAAALHPAALAAGGVAISLTM
jgi:hypothetical protein